MKTNMHENSLLTWQEEEARLGKRAKVIYEHLKAHPHECMTDRQIMMRLGFNEPNSVRPRITELIHAKLVEEVGNTRCLVTKKRVRLVRVVQHEAQLDLL